MPYQPIVTGTAPTAGYTPVVPATSANSGYQAVTAPAPAFNFSAPSSTFIPTPATQTSVSTPTAVIPKVSSSPNPAPTPIGGTISEYNPKNSGASSAPISVADTIRQQQKAGEELGQFPTETGISGALNNLLPGIKAASEGWGSYQDFLKTLPGNQPLVYQTKDANGKPIVQLNTVEAEKVKGLAVGFVGGEESTGAAIDTIAKSQNPNQIADLIEQHFPNIPAGDAALYAPKLTVVEDPARINAILQTADLSGSIRSEFPHIEKPSADVIAKGAYDLKQSGAPESAITDYINQHVATFTPQELTPAEMPAGTNINIDNSVPPQTPAEASTRYYNDVIEPQLGQGKTIELAGDNIKAHFGNDYNPERSDLYAKANYDNVARLIKDPSIKDITFLAGGPGSGKSEFLGKNIKANHGADLLYDNSFSSVPGIKNLLTIAENLGKNVNVSGIIANQQNARVYANKRAEQTGRVVTDEQFNKAHAGFLSTISTLLQDGTLDPRQVKLFDLRNVTSEEEARKIIKLGLFAKDPVALLKKVGYNAGNAHLQSRTGEENNGGAINAGSGGAPSAVPASQRGVQGGGNDSGSSQELFSGENGSNSTTEQANKEYLKQADREAKAELPAPEKLQIKKATSQVKEVYSKNQSAAQSAFTEVQATFDIAEAGKRIPVYSGSAGGPDYVIQRLTFPQWVPQNLRSKDLFKTVMKDVHSLSDLQYPERLNSTKQAQLINTIFDLIDFRTGQDTSAIRAGIMDLYTPEGRVDMQTENIRNKMADRGAKHISEEIGKDEKRKATIERIKQATEAAQRKFEEAAQQRANYLATLEKVKKEAKLKPSLKKMWRNVVSPLKNVDAKTQEIYKTWRISKLTSVETERELEQAIAQEAERTGFQNSFNEILDQEAGAKIPYITNATEGQYTEAKRAGFELGHRENHMSLLLDNTPKEVQDALTKYLKDKGVDGQLAEEVAAGNKELPSDLALNLKINPSFIKSRTFPDYATAIKYGLTPKYTTPAEIIAHNQGALEQAIANRKFIQELIDNHKILNPMDAPRNWKYIQTPFTFEEYKASPELAKVIESIMNKDMGVYEHPIKHQIGHLVHLAQSTRLSGGPKNFHFFGIAQAIKSLTTAVGDVAMFDFKSVPSDLKNAYAFFKTNFNKPTADWFIEKQPFFNMMAREGIDTSNRIGGLKETSWSRIYEKLTSPKWNNKWLAGKETLKKVFTEATFGGYMPMMMENTFEHSYNQALQKGADADSARKFAADITKHYYGLLDDYARSGLMDDMTKIFFFAPQFRESLIHFFINSGRAWTTDIKDPTYAKNRAFIVGAVLTYLLYNYVNQKEQGHPIWQNGATDIGNAIVNIPDSIGKYLPGFKSGDKVKIPFLPSISAFARSAIGGAVAFAQGDFKTTLQQVTGLTSIVFQTVEQAFMNKDYFGRAIYKDTDPFSVKATKIATFMGLAVNHPWIQGIINLITNKVPIYQNLSETLQLPLKFTNDKKLATSAYYDMLAKQTNQKASTLVNFQSTYSNIRNILKSGDKAKANELYNVLSPAEKKTYDSMKKTETMLDTIHREQNIYPIVQKNQELKAEGKKAEADAIYADLSKEDRHAYDLVKKKFTGQ